MLIHVLKVTHSKTIINAYVFIRAGFAGLLKPFSRYLRATAFIISSSEMLFKVIRICRPVGIGIYAIVRANRPRRDGREDKAHSYSYGRYVRAEGEGKRDGRGYLSTRVS